MQGTNNINIFIYCLQLQHVYIWHIFNCSWVDTRWQ